MDARMAQVADEVERVHGTAVAAKIDWSTMRQAGPLAEELERYTTAQLVAEVNRRRMSR